MRKRLACIIFLLVISLQLVIAAKTDSFEISAYKIGADDSDAEFFKLYIVDSMYDSFLGFDSTEIKNEIIINDKVNHLFDDLQTNPEPRTTTFNADTMIFHVIALGNRAGNYSLNLSFSPLVNEDSVVIDSAYTMGNARVNFENSEPSITEGADTYIYENNLTSLPVFGWPGTEEKWNYSYAPISPTKNFSEKISDGKGTLLLDWRISKITEASGSLWYDYTYYRDVNTSTKTPLWIARAAVAMSIDKKDYDSSPEGRYTSEVTVTFTQK